MFLKEFFRSPRTPILEGGNLAAGQPGWKGDPGAGQAQQINLQVTNRSVIIPILNKLLADIDAAYQAKYQEPLWDPKLLRSQKFLSGSSLHFFNVKGIPDKTFVEKKPKVGDIDTMVDKEKEANLDSFLEANLNKQIGDALFLGYQRGNEQFSSLWQLNDPPIKIQIDLEFVAFDKAEPTPWSRFSHSSDWNDLQAGVKGVFHKFLIQSFAVLTKKQFILRKQEGRGKARTWVDKPAEDAMFSFAVSSKEGGGLRAKYTPVLNPTTNEPEMKDGLPVMMALPAAGYEQDIGKMFQSLFGVKLNPATAKKLADKFWSFTGLLEVMNTLLEPEEKSRVLGSFLNKTFGDGAQGLYKNDPDRDSAEKMAAINLLMKVTGAKPPDGMDVEQMRQTYVGAYKMTEEMVDEDSDPTAPPKPNYARQGIQHIYNRLPDGRVSSMEMKDDEFINLCKEIADNGGTLNDIPISLKVDGAGIRFGKDESGRAFFMTSKVTEPLYADNIGYFTNFGVEKGQSAENLARTKKYDDALSLIVNSKFIQTLPSDTIVQAEMLYNDMAQNVDGQLKFVNIPYDPKRLGKQMTLVPFTVKQYSTGEELPNQDKIIQKLISSGDNNIKIITNNLEHKGINVSNIIEPVINMDPGLVSSLKVRGSNPQKEQAKQILDQARQQLSSAIVENPKLKGKDVLGSNMEGIVVNMPSGKLFKVTSQQMKSAMAAKMAKPGAKQEGPVKTAVVAIGSFAGHLGHEDLFNATINKAKQLGGDPYLFIGNAVGKDDPIPPNVKVETWHKLYPEYANNISAVMDGGSIMQKVKHELINPQPGQPPKYDNVVIMVGQDRANMPIAGALMKAVNKFPGYEHVKATLETIPRTRPVSFTELRNVLKNPNLTPEQQYAAWAQKFNEKKLGKDWILHLMDISRKNMGIINQPQQNIQERLLNSLVRAGRNTKIIENSEVISLQQYLNSKGAKLAVDGIIGAKTRQAIQQFLKGDNNYKQSATGVEVDKLGMPIKASDSPAPAKPTSGGGLKPPTATSGQGLKVSPTNALSEPTFLPKVAQVSQRLGIDKDDLIGIMKHESGLDPTRTNSIGATGLIQFMPNTARGLGTSTDELRQMSGTEQMNFVEKYFKPIAGKIKDLGDLYMYTFLPRAVGRPDDFVIGVKGDQGSLFGLSKDKLYRQNSGFDADKKGYFTVGDVKRRIMGFKESMMPKKAFAGSDKNKLGPSAHLKGKMKRPAKAGDLVGGMEENRLVPLSEDVSRIMSSLINEIIKK